MSWFSDKGINSKLESIHEEILALKKDVGDIACIALEEAAKYHGAAQPPPPTASAVDPVAMLKSISALYVESVNQAAVVQEGYKSLITAILLKVGNLGISKEMQEVSLDKSFEMTFRDGDVFLSLKNTTQQETREQLED